MQADARAAESQPLADLWSKLECSGTTFQNLTHDFSNAFPAAPNARREAQELPSQNKAHPTPILYAVRTVAF